jgi:hypothetical protein
MRANPFMTVVAVTILAVAGVAAFVYFADAYGRTSQGTVVGQLEIGPFCPVEPIGGCPVPTSTYTSREIVLRPAQGSTITIPLNGTGGFSARVGVGTYSLTITNCTFAGCSSALPKTVIVLPDQATFVDISIDTGIR